MTHTTLEQSKVLMHLGLDEKTADLTIISNDFAPYFHTKESKRGTKEYPCWSAEALLEILPDEVYVDEDKDTGYLTVLKEGDSYNVFYESRERTDEELVFIQSIGEDLADVLFKIVEWLLTNKLI